jgi:hypothetical protein
MQVEKVSNDVLMSGAHCGLAPAYFADEDIFETSADFEKKSQPRSLQNHRDVDHCGQVVGTNRRVRGAVRRPGKQHDERQGDEREHKNERKNVVVDLHLRG